MNSEYVPELTDRAYRSVFKDCVADAALAQSAIKEQLDEMVKEEKVHLMTDEEEQLLRSFRRFKLTAKKPGAVFKWQTTPDGIDPIIVDATEGVHIVHPQEVE